MAVPAATAAPDEGERQRKKKQMKLKHARVLAKEAGSKRFAALRREKRAEKRARTVRGRPLSREESDSAALAIEDTVKELISMGFEEKAAREAVQKARQDLRVASNSPAVTAEPLSASQTSSAGRKRKSPTDSAEPAALGAAVAPERTFNVWTAEQLDALNAAAAEQGLTDAKMDDRWQAVADRVGHGRSASACRHRWAALQQGKGAPSATEATSPSAVQPKTAEPRRAEKVASAAWKSRKAESLHATKIFIGNARALGGEEEVIKFFAAADDEDSRVGGMLTEVQWLSGKADGCCFARCSSAAAASAALALNGTEVSSGQQLLVQMAHEVSFKSVVPKLKTIRSGESTDGAGIGPAPQLPVPKGCRGVFLSNLSFELDEATLEWWCNDFVGGDGAEGQGTGGMVSSVRLLTAADQAAKQNGKDDATKDEAQEHDSETATAVSQAQDQKQKHKHKHAGCAVVEFKHPAVPSIERMIAKHGSSLLSRPVPALVNTHCRCVCVRVSVRVSLRFCLCLCLCVTYMFPGAGSG